MDVSSEPCNLNNSGQVALTEVLGIVLLIIATVTFAFLLLPKWISDMYGLIALSSAEVVARDLARLVTISGAAPHDITIRDRLHSSYEYDVDIENRLVRVKLLTVQYGMKGEAIAKSGVDGIEYHGKSINYLEIKKEIVGGENIYKVEGWYEPS